MQRLPSTPVHVDARGAMWQIAREPWAEANFVVTSAGQRRGDHYHKDCRELFYILSGRIDIVIRNVRTGEHIEFTASAGDRFIVEPYELHTFEIRSDAQWINMLSRPMDPASPDIWRVEKKMEQTV